MTNLRRAYLLSWPIAVVVLLFGMLAVPLPLAAQSPYRVLHRWQVGGDGWWDYLHVDSAAHRLYIAHGDHVAVVDTRTGKEIGNMTGFKGLHGVALDTAGRFGYVSDGGANEVVVFDRATLARVAAIPAGTNPDGILFDPATQTVWAFNGRSHNATVIDAATRKVVATIALPGKPEFAVSDGRGNIFDNIEDKSEVVRINAHAHVITATWPAGCESPSGLALDAAGRRLFPVCDGNKMSVLDANTGRLLATAHIGDGPDAARWSAAHKLAFASCGEGVLSVVDASKPGYPTIQTLPTERGARTMAYDAATDRIYTVTAKFGPRPKPTPQNPYGRPAMLPGTFTVIVIGR
ncbi:MAG TPA: YncE family protein [Terracidiphilus sp.]|nr:YncE family protein [Terracidiphilus sp.]